MVKNNFNGSRRKESASAIFVHLPHSVSLEKGTYKSHREDFLNDEKIAAKIKEVKKLHRDSEWVINLCLAMIFKNKTSNTNRESLKNDAKLLRAFIKNNDIEKLKNPHFIGTKESTNSQKEAEFKRDHARGASLAQLQKQYLSKWSLSGEVRNKFSKKLSLLEKTDDIDPRQVNEIKEIFKKFVQRRKLKGGPASRWEQPSGTVTINENGSSNHIFKISQDTAENFILTLAYILKTGNNYHDELAIVFVEKVFGPIQKRKKNREKLEDISPWSILEIYKKDYRKKIIKRFKNKATSKTSQKDAHLRILYPPPEKS